MPPIISIVGKSNSGKTTLLERLIAELERRGHKLVVIKHTGEFEFDTIGKDSWRLSHAAKGPVVISSPQKYAIIQKTEHDLYPQELAQLIGGDYELILTEGFKKASTPKIEVHRKEQGKDLVCPPEQLLAVVTDEPLDVSVPQFAKEEPQKLADLIENWLPAKTEQEELEMVVNGAVVATNPFVKDILSRILVAMVSGLKGVKEVHSLRATLRRKP